VVVKATMTSKGQLTVPVAIRREMGLRAGDEVEFTLVDGVATLHRLPSDTNPFAKWVGRLGVEPDGAAVAWQRELREE
jgi:antitoxin PrlF